MHHAHCRAHCARAVSFALMLIPVQLTAQGSLQLTAGGGLATDTRGIRSSIITVAPSVSYAPSPRSWLGAGASVSRFGGGDYAFSGNAGGGGRATLSSHAAVVVAGGASYTRATYGASFATADVLPALELSRGAFVASAGARATAAMSSVPTTTAGPFGRLTGSSADTSRVAMAFVASAGFRGMALAEGGMLDLLYREERGSVADAPLVDRTMSLARSAGSVVLTAHVGARHARGARETFGGAGVVLAAASPLGLHLSAGRYASNPLTSVPGGTFASAAIVFRSRAPAAARMPAPRGVGSPATGRTRVSLRAPDARRVEVAGDWNGWRTIALQRAGNGVWYADLALEPGRYRYAFKVDGSKWTVPEGVPAVDDELGGKSAWLTVPSR